MMEKIYSSDGIEIKEWLIPFTFGRKFWLCEIEWENSNSIYKKIKSEILSKNYNIKTIHLFVSKDTWSKYIISYNNEKIINRIEYFVNLKKIWMVEKIYHSLI